MNVGYVGLGAMGRALAGRLVGGKESLLVWDLNAAAQRDFAERGAEVAGSLADLAARCDVIFLCLPKSANVESALFDETGLCQALRPGAIIVDQTSGDPACSREFARRLAQQDVVLIDAPVSGGVPSAVAGTITIMASGDSEAFERVSSVLHAISTRVFHCSTNVGDAQAIKALNNNVNTANRLLTLEVTAVGRHLGLTTAAMAEQFNQGAGNSFLTERLLPAIVEQRSSTDFALALMVKDLSQAADLGISMNALLPVSETARGLLNIALSVLGGDARLDDVVGFMEQIMKTRYVDANDAAGAADDDLQCVDAALAAGNRIVMLENTALARSAGIDLDRYAEVMASGSAGSREAVRLFDAMRNEHENDARTINDWISALTRLSEAGARCAVPMLMTNLVRARCLEFASRLGGDVSIDAMHSGLCRPV